MGAWSRFAERSAFQRGAVKPVLKELAVASGPMPDALDPHWVSLGDEMVPEDSW